MEYVERRGHQRANTELGQTITVLCKRETTLIIKMAFYYVEESIRLNAGTTTAIEMKIKTSRVKSIREARF